jgi:hypothetical protein
MNANDRAWLKSLPLLLMSSFLKLGAAWLFFKGTDNTASIAAFSAGLILLGSWLASAIIDWYEGHPQAGIRASRIEEIPEEVLDDESDRG